MVTGNSKTKKMTRRWQWRKYVKDVDKQKKVDNDDGFRRHRWMKFTYEYWMTIEKVEERIMKYIHGLPPWEIFQEQSSLRYCPSEICGYRDENYI